MSDKLCPLLMVRRGDLTCRKDKCAWWMPYFYKEQGGGSRCAITDIADQLAGVANILFEDQQVEIQGR